MSEIRLRHIVDRDVGWMLEIRNKPENLEHLRNPRMISFREQEHWWKKFQKDWDQDLLIIERQSDLVTTGGLEFIPIGVGGVTHIERFNHAGEMSLVMEFPKNPEWAIEALKLIVDYGHNTLNLFRLWVECYTDDRTELFKGAGFRVEGRKMNALWRKGQYWNTTLLSRFQGDLIPQETTTTTASTSSDEWTPA